MRANTAADLAKKPEARRPKAAARKKTARRPTRKKRKIGRPTDYSPRMASAIVKARELGLTLDDCAESVGIAPSTLFKWQAKFPDFAERLTRARAKLKPELFRRIVEGTKKDPRLALAFAERLFPNELYRGRKLTIEGGDPEKPIAVKASADEELREIARKLAGMTTEDLLAFKKPRGDG